MARSKSTTGTKTTRSRANSKAKQEEQIVEASISGTADANVRAQAGPAARAAEQTIADPHVVAESTVASETRPQEVARESYSPEARKLGVVKSEARKSVVVPINLEDEIRRRAYELYQQRGNAPGSEAEDWFAAEREVRQRYQQQQHSA